MPRWLNFDTVASFDDPGNGEKPPPDDDPIPPAGAKYVSTSGNNTNTGTKASPWRNVQHGISQIGAGDTLVLRGSSNREDPAMFRETISCPNKSGAGSSNKITIMVEPGEYACISGSKAVFETPGNNAWELHHSGTQTYRSVDTGHSANRSSLGGFKSTDGRCFRFNWYDLLTDLTATRYTWTGQYGNEQMYRGPGFHRASDGRIYVRLQNLAPPRDAGVASWPSGGRLHHAADVRNTPPSNAHGGGNAAFDPRNYAIFISTAGDICTVNGSWYEFIRVEFSHGDRGVFLSGASNVRFYRCKVMNVGGCFRMVSGANNITFDACILDPCYPPYCTWTGVKGDGGKPQCPRPDEWRIQGEHKEQLWGADESAHHLLIKNCHLGRTFDGATPSAGAHDIQILHCVCDYIGDDFIQWRAASYNIELGWNYLNGPGPGYDGASTSNPRHTVYIHHNVIDSARGEGGNWGNGHGGDDNPTCSNTNWTNSDPMWKPSHQPIPRHGQDRTHNHAVKFYNNTFLYHKNNSNMGAQMDPYDSNVGPHRAYNNIIYVTEGTGVYMRDLQIKSTFEIDNNLYWRNGGTSNVFNNFPGGSYRTLAAWKSSGSNTRNYEANSQEQSPQFTSGAVPNSLFRLMGRQPDFSQLDYRPRNAICKTMGRDLSSTGWPGTSSARWVGAVDPNGTSGLGSVGPEVSTIGP